MSKTSLVTGGLSGIGKAITEKLIARGDKVYIFDYLSKEELILHPSIGYFQVDISSVDSINKGFTKLFAELNSTLDIVVNNAGISLDALAIRLSEEHWDKVLDTNLKGMFFCAQNAIKHMLKNKIGYIINISSIIGQRGNPGQVNYSASKAGVIALTKTLALEYGSKNILVNAIAPGFIETRMTSKLSEFVKQKVLERIALKRFGTADDIADLVLFLTSGNANYITGSVINVDGGIN